MGKLLKATANLYWDSGFSNLAGFMTNVKIGIPVGDTAAEANQNIQNVQTFFTNKMAAVEARFLGGDYFHSPYISIPEAKLPSLWLPLCAEHDEINWLDPYYLEYVFENGAKMRRTGTISSSAGWAYFAADGTTIGTVANKFYAPYSPLSTPTDPNSARPTYHVFVVSAMSDDGTIPASATAADYYLNATFGSDMYGLVDPIASEDLVILREFFNAIEGDVRNSDPYSEGGSSSTGGGTGTFSDTGDAISIPGLPTLSATSAGFITIFNPSAAQMASLAGYMWSGAFDLETFRKIFANPMDCILGLSIVPVDVPAGGSAEVKVGNIGTGIYMTKAASQYVEVDCGTLNVEEFWGAYLDYDPYTKAEIYLPYIGTHPIAVDDIMGKPVHVVYHVDILSGACVAYVKCGDSVLYSFIGQCSSSIPISGNDWTNVVNGVLSIAGSIGTMVATGGASAPAAVGRIVSTAVNTLKPTVEKSGSLSGTGGMMGIQTPYLILTRPQQALPAKQNTYTGYPSFITASLESLSGYTEIEEIHLENVPATSGELDEIISLLKGGVIL